MKRFLWLLLLFPILISCWQVQPDLTLQIDHNYISEYSADISVKDRFFVTFSNDYITEGEILSEVASDIFSVHLHVSG